MNEDDFLNELLSLVQAQDRLLQIFKAQFDLRGIEFGSEMQLRYYALAQRLRKIQATVKRGLGG